MAVTNIPDAHHVVRHCKNKLILRRDGEIVGVHPELFHLRAASETRKQETYLSAIYYEGLKCANHERWAHCCDALPLSPKPKDALARLSAGSIREQGVKRSVKLRVTHEGKPRTPAYAAIRGLPIEPDNELCILLAEVALTEIVEVSAI